METKEEPTFKFRLTVERSRSDKKWRPSMTIKSNRPGNLGDTIESRRNGSNIVIMSNHCSEYIEQGLVWINARAKGERLILPQHHPGYDAKDEALKEADNMKNAISRTLKRAKKQYDEA